MGALGVAAVVEGALDTLIVVAALEVLAMGDTGAGTLCAVWGLAGIAGGVAALALRGRGRLASGLTLGCLCMGLPIVALGLWTTVPIAFAALLVYGVGFGLQETASMTLLQRLATEDVLARVFGVTETVYLLAVGVGAPIGALLAAALGVPGASVAVGVALPVFAPLSVATHETLALRMTPVDVAPGDRVVTQGEPGDAFYAVSAGRFDVPVDGRVVRTIGEGECFGEIALVRRTRRTATVVARTAGQVFALGGAEFVLAVTGHPCSREATADLIDERWRHAAPQGRPDA